MDGNGGAWPIRVGLADVNGTTTAPRLQIGHNNANQWISSIDVVAHEMGHGIDDHTPAESPIGHPGVRSRCLRRGHRVYSNQAAAYDPPDFLVGEEINLVGQGPIRNMYDPSQLGDPNCYSSSIPGTEVHAAAGPGTTVLPAVPGQQRFAREPDCNSSTVTGLGIQKAMRIMYNAMLMKTSKRLLPEVPHLDADRGQEPVLAQLRRVQHRQGGVGRR